METYLSGAKEAWRVIHQGLPLTTDRKTPQMAIDAAIKAYPSIKISNQYWDNEALEFIPVSHLHKRKANPAPRKYRGKYPRRIQSVGSAGGETVFQLNDGSVYKVPTKMLIDLGYRNQSPGPGTDFDLMIGNDFDYVQHAIKTVRRTNPAKRTAPKKRAISRPSQVTKKAPTKRLLARRKIAAKKPVKGYFPNPGKDEFLVQVCSPISVPLASRKWTTVLKFKTEKEAKETALQMARIDRLDRSWRVMKK